MKAFVDFAAYDHLQNDTFDRLNLRDDQLTILPIRIFAFALQTRKWGKWLQNV